MQLTILSSSHHTFCAGPGAGSEFIFQTLILRCVLVLALAQTNSSCLCWSWRWLRQNHYSGFLPLLLLCAGPGAGPDKFICSFFQTLLLHCAGPGAGSDKFSCFTLPFKLALCSWSLHWDNGGTIVSSFSSQLTGVGFVGFVEFVQFVGSVRCRSGVGQVIQMSSMSSRS